MPPRRIELRTFGLQDQRSTTELSQVVRARSGNGCGPEPGRFSSDFSHFANSCPRRAASDRQRRKKRGHSRTDHIRSVYGLESELRCSANPLCAVFILGLCKFFLPIFTTISFVLHVFSQYFSLKLHDG